MTMRADDVDKTADVERELLLSLYLDGELEEERRAAVEAKIQTDPLWRKDFELLRAADEHITKAVHVGWHDEKFTTKVRTRVENLPPPAADVFPAARGGLSSEKADKPTHWGLLILVVCAVFAAAFFLLWLMRDRA
jgi:anti-sigma factor RsiW